MGATLQAAVPVGLDSRRRIVNGICAIVWASALFGVIAYLSNSLVPFWVLLILVLVALTISYTVGFTSTSGMAGSEEIALSADGSSLPSIFVKVET